MSFLKKLFGGASLDGNKLAASMDKAEYGQIELLAYFATGAPIHAGAERVRWGRVLPQPYEEMIKSFEKQGWLQAHGERYQVTAAALPFVESYRQRQLAEKNAVLPKVRQALQAKDTSEALELRRAYEARQPLGVADWTGPEPQLSHSALTRRILFLQHWLLDGLSKETIDWLKLYAAEQHLWGTHWRLNASDIPQSVKSELTRTNADAVEAAYWKAYQLALYVDNQETWQRCKGGDHVRRIEIKAPEDMMLCPTCKALAGKDFLVARTPELPLKECTCTQGCLLRYEPVLESYE
ncbi:MAG: hypothetical protein U0175_37370 [Caldilineaceae bacterium]